MGSSISLSEIESETIRGYIEKHIAWSKQTFGDGPHLEGLLRHIEKEVDEIRDEAVLYGNQENIPAAREFVDIIILALDAMWRQGLTPEEITHALMDKQHINKSRKYPKITDPNQPTEHIREE